jgi:hypothetical protein
MSEVGHPYLFGKVILWRRIVRPRRRNGGGGGVAAPPMSGGKGCSAAAASEAHGGNAQPIIIHILYTQLRVLHPPFAAGY